MDRNQEFAGKRVLVTGAGKGIGYATALLLARRGAAVIALSRSLEDLEALDEAIGEPHGCEIIAVDIAETEFLLRAVAHAHPIDLLVNCAGVAAVESFLDTSLEDFDKLMAVNVRASMLIAQECATRHDRPRQGRIDRQRVEHGRASRNAASRSLWRVEGGTRCAHARDGRRNSVCTASALIRSTPSSRSRRWPRKCGARRKNPGRCLHAFRSEGSSSPKKSRTLIAFLLSDESSMVNGVSLAVDGGFQAG